MKYLIILIILIINTSIYSQQYSISSGKDEYSVGQVFYEYNNGGIQIPYESDITLHLPKLQTLGIVIYPNPTKHNIIIETGNYEYLNYKLFNLTGKLVKKNIIRNKESICMEGLDKGMYLLNLEKEIFKIIKL